MSTRRNKHTDESGPAPEPAQYALGIECSNPSAGSFDVIALAKITKQRTKSSTDAAPPGYTLEHFASAPMHGAARGSDALVETIATLCSTYSVRPEMLERVCVSIGPGGYTSLRVSVTAAKTIAYASGCDLYGVQTHDALAPLIDASGKPAMTLLASKGDSAHACAHVEGSGPQVLGVVEAPVLRSHAPKVLLCDSHAPKAFLELANELGIEIRPVRFDPFGCVQASLGLTKSDPMSLNVFYAREPDAVTQWRLLHGSED